MLVELVLKQIYANFPAQKVAVIAVSARKGTGHELQVVGCSRTKGVSTRVGPTLPSHIDIDTLAYDVNAALDHVGSDVYNLVAECVLEIKSNKAVTGYEIASK